MKTLQRRVFAVMLLSALAGCERGGKIWEQAGRFMMERYAAGDIVVITPAWEKGRIGHFEGLAAVTASDSPSSLDLSSYSRLWLVFEGRAPANTLTALKRVYGEGEEFRINGYLAAHLFDLRKKAKASDEYDFLAGLSKATVRMVFPDREMPCSGWHVPKGQGGPRCEWGSAGWQYVGLTDQPFDGAYRNCIWAHPTEGAQLVIDFGEVPRGEEIAGHFGIADTGVDNSAGRTVTLSILADGRSAGEYSTGSRRGWFDFKAQIVGGSGIQDKPKTSVQFKITTTGEHGRHFCFDAVMKKRPAAGAENRAE